MGCDPSPGGNCSQPDGIHTCKIENQSHCYVSSGASCSKIINNSGLGLFMGAHPETQDLAIFMKNIPRGVTVSNCGCTGGMKDWTVGGVSCRANLPDLAHGETLEINDTTTPGTGAATYSCTGATLTGPTGVSCDSLPPTRCPETDLSWRVGSNTCEMRVLASDDGTPVSALDSTSPTTGTADFTCNGTAWSAPSNPVCNAAPTLGCSLPKPHTWTVTNARGSIKTCTLGGSGDEVFAENEQKTLSGGLPIQWGSYPTRGSIVYKCEADGTLTLVSKSCLADCTLKCNDGGGSETFQWPDLSTHNPRLYCYCQGNRLETVQHNTSRSFRADANSGNGGFDIACDDGEFTYTNFQCRAGVPD